MKALDMPCVTVEQVLRLREHAIETDRELEKVAELMGMTRGDVISAHGGPQSAYDRQLKIIVGTAVATSINRLAEKAPHDTAEWLRSCAEHYLRETESL